MSWPSTKLQTATKKKLMIKNTSNKRLVIRIKVTGPGFQLSQNESNNLTLQSMECYPLYVTFCPTVMGAAIGYLSFYSPLGTTSSNTEYLKIPLYGFGGTASVVIMDLMCSPSGSPFILLGDLYNRPDSFKTTFYVHNKGPQTCFAYFSLEPANISMTSICKEIIIEPDRILVPPNCHVVIHCELKPNREDLYLLRKNIQNLGPTVANLKVVTGDEANRQRIRVIMNQHKMHEKQYKSNLLDHLWREFPEEVQYEELLQFNEPPSILMELITQFRLHQIPITFAHHALNESLDSSSMFDGDVTVLFRTICAPSPSGKRALDAVHEESAFGLDEEEAIINANTELGWTVNPKVIDFDFYARRRSKKSSFVIKNSFKSRQYFEVNCNYKNLLLFTPNEGYVEPDGGQIEVIVGTKYLQPPANLARDIVIVVS